MSRLRLRTTVMSISDRPGLDAVIRRAAGEVGDAGARDHRLGRRAALVDACPADMLALDQRHLPPGAGQRRRQRPARLPRADHDAVVRCRARHPVTLLRGRRPSSPCSVISPSLRRSITTCTAQIVARKADHKHGRTMRRDERKEEDKHAGKHAQARAGALNGARGGRRTRPVLNADRDETESERGAGQPAGAGRRARSPGGLVRMYCTPGPSAVSATTSGKWL